MKYLENKYPDLAREFGIQVAGLILSSRKQGYQITEYGEIQFQYLGNLGQKSDPYIEQRN